MLPSQRALFDIPREVCFLNAASWSPLPLAVQEAGRAAVAHKGQPWKLPADFQPKQYERARKAAAALIGAESGDVSLIPSVGYGVATAGKVLTIPRGNRVLVLQDDHTSPVLEWMSRAEAGGFKVEQVKQPTDGDWTSAVLAANRWPWCRSPRSIGRTAAHSTWRASPRRPRQKARRCWSMLPTMSASAVST
jgi:selenocysteine lyase/cysteine desulfurase